MQLDSEGFWHRWPQHLVIGVAFFAFAAVRGSDERPPAEVPDWLEALDWLVFLGILGYAGFYVARFVARRGRQRDRPASSKHRLGLDPRRLREADPGRTNKIPLTDLREAQGRVLDPEVSARSVRRDSQKVDRSRAVISTAWATAIMLFSFTAPKDTAAEYVLGAAWSFLLVWLIAWWMIGKRRARSAAQAAAAERAQAAAAERAQAAAAELRRRRRVAADLAPYRREVISKRVKDDVWRRDRGRCVECGSQQRLEFDHVIPVSRGGSNTARNIQLLCEHCNRRKGANI